MNFFWTQKPGVRTRKLNHTYTQSCKIRPQNLYFVTTHSTKKQSTYKTWIILIFQEKINKSNLEMNFTNRSISMPTTANSINNTSTFGNPLVRILSDNFKSLDTLRINHNLIGSMNLIIRNDTVLQHKPSRPPSFAIIHPLVQHSTYPVPHENIIDFRIYMIIRIRIGVDVAVYLVARVPDRVGSTRIRRRRHRRRGCNRRESYLIAKRRSTTERIMHNREMTWRWSLDCVSAMIRFHYVRERERGREMREMIKLVRIQVENRLGISFRYGCVYVDVSVCIGLEREYRRRRRLKSRWQRRWEKWSKKCVRIQQSLYTRPLCIYSILF